MRNILKALALVGSRTADGQGQAKFWRQRGWAGWARGAAVAALALGAWGTAQAGAPVVSNLRASQQAGTGLVNILYDVSDPEGDHLTVSVMVSLDGGATYNTVGRSFSGTGYGTNVIPGVNKAIVWDAGSDLDPLLFSHVKVKVTADDGAWNAPAEMCYVPPGNFAMGDTLGDGGTEERPTHTVYVSGFYMDKFEVTQAVWSEVVAWGGANGYSIGGGGAYGTNHPIHSVAWYDVVKWCNARSEMHGRTPVYYTSAAQTEIYKTGQVGLTNACVRWTADGYRLPTEAEWEKAARGGLSGKRYAWGDTASCTDANYNACATSTKEVGYYAANGFGLYDMAGNVFEWCWDCYENFWYWSPDAVQNDTRGPSGLQSYRVLRGGSWVNLGGTSVRCADRYQELPSSGYVAYGFRCVRGL